MTTNCELVQRALVEAFDEQLRLPPEVTDHIRDCPSCAPFARLQHELDERLSAFLTPPALSPEFRERLRIHVRRDPLTQTREWLPEAMHAIACGVVVSMFVLFAPGDAATTIMRGLVASLLAYSVLSIGRTWLDA